MNTSQKQPIPIPETQSNPVGIETSLNNEPVASKNVHNRSHAAHLEEDAGTPHTKPSGNLRQGAYPTGRRQP